MIRLRVACGLLALVVAVAGCGDDGDDAEAVASETADDAGSTGDDPDAAEQASTDGACAEVDGYEVVADGGVSDDLLDDDPPEWPFDTVEQFQVPREQRCRLFLDWWGDAGPLVVGIFTPMDASYVPWRDEGVDARPERDLPGECAGLAALLPEIREVVEPVPNRYGLAGMRLGLDGLADAFEACASAGSNAEALEASVETYFEAQNAIGGAISGAAVQGGLEAEQIPDAAEAWFELADDPWPGRDDGTGDGGDGGDGGDAG